MNSTEYPALFAAEPSRGPRCRPLPPLLTALEPGTWAHDTMSRRIREEILTRIFRENTFFSSEAVNRLQQLEAELAAPTEHCLRRLEEPAAGEGVPPDLLLWNERILPPFLACNWLSSPWCVAEFYFYRRVMEAVGYFETKLDPFRHQKELGVSAHIETMSRWATRVLPLLESPLRRSVPERRHWLLHFVRIAMNGNRMDLSLWPVGGESAQTDTETGVHVLADDSEQLWAYVSARMPLNQVGIIVDNAGLELFSDLLLADHLVHSGLAQSVMFHTKGHPTFVSDATAADLHWMIDYLGKLPTNTPLQRLARRWERYLLDGRWQCRDDLFWAQPQAFWEMDAPLWKCIQNQQLVFVKGDANYRRLLGDRAWPLNTPFSDVVAYWPTAICALRALKAELGCGIPEAASQYAAGRDPKWMVNGRWAVLQFFAQCEP
ncbi:hypothetical protein CCYA_CCYA03G0952 [Cyanidiococcus yangmingshanensis]|nr:hypothetical protein CCYA_CCYA03G0952 [Cyanidiococcus yangmingshanensis]